MIEIKFVICFILILLFSCNKYTLDNTAIIKNKYNWETIYFSNTIVRENPDANSKVIKILNKYKKIQVTDQLFPSEPMYLHNFDNIAHIKNKWKKVLIDGKIEGWIIYLFALTDDEIKLVRTSESYIQTKNPEIKLEQDFILCDIPKIATSYNSMDESIRGAQWEVNFCSKKAIWGELNGICVYLTLDLQLIDIHYFQ